MKTCSASVWGTTLGPDYRRKLVRGEAFVGDAESSWEEKHTRLYIPNCFPSRPTLLAAYPVSDKKRRSPREDVAESRIRTEE